MKTIRFLLIPASLPLLALAVSFGNLAQAQQPTFSLLYTFQRVGGTPVSILESSPGEFLGVLETSPSVFAVNSSGNLNVLYSFPTSTTPYPLVSALNGRAYGAAGSSGGTSLAELLWVGAKGAVSTLQYNGATQGGPYLLAQSPDTYLYAFFDVVGVFIPTFARLGTNGEPTTLYTFTAAQGLPQVLFLGPGGDFYGLTSMSNGTTLGIFKITPAGSFSWINQNIPNPSGLAYIPGLILASNGNFYGTLPQGGTARAGIIYEVTMDGAYSVVHQFTEPDTGVPETLLEASDGMIYVTTRGFFEQGEGYSSVMQLNPSTGKLATMYEFTNAANGECECRFVQGSDGKLYGVTENAGTYQAGTIFSLNLGLPAPKPYVSYIGPSSAAAGDTILLFGANLFSTSAVRFNGAPATEFVVASAQGVWVKVPEGATTGPITVTTPNGSFTSQQSFTVE